MTPTPRTAAGRLLLMAGLTFHSGRRLADYPQMIVDIEAQAAPPDALREALALKGLAEAIERAHISQGDDAETDARAILEHLPVISNVRPWKYLYDDYEAGTVFITRDPQNDQTPLVAGLTIEQAAPIVAALNSIPSSPSAEEWRPLVLGPNEMHGGGRGSYVTPAAASPVAAAIDVKRLAPSVYAQGHGQPDHCAEHGDIPRTQSMVWHVREAHGLTQEQWYTLEEADRIRGVQPFDPHAVHDHAAPDAEIEQARAALAAAPATLPAIDTRIVWKRDHGMVIVHSTGDEEPQSLEIPAWAVRTIFDVAGKDPAEEARKVSAFINAHTGLNVERLIRVVRHLPAWSPHPDVKGRVTSPLVQQEDVVNAIEHAAAYDAERQGER